MKKAVFLDRDGTINVEKDYLYRIEEFEFLPGVENALRKLYDAGYILVLITNQSGIARGYYSREDYEKLDCWLKERLKENGSPLAESYYCPHLPGGKIAEFAVECDCRKPKTGLFDQAVKAFDIDLSQSYAVGDRMRDLAICNSSPCRGFLIGNTESETVIAGVKAGNNPNVLYEPDLKAAAELILRT